MKQFVLAAVIALTGSISMAGALDAADYDYSNEVAVKAAPCVDGTKKSFYEPRANGLDGNVYVTRTCVNGSYFPKTAVKIIRCKDGARTTFPVFNNVNDSVRYEVRTCVNGKYVRN